MKLSRFFKNSLSIAAVALLIVALGAGAAEPPKTPKIKAPDKEKKLTSDQVPAPVMAAFKIAYPKAVIKGISQETEDSLTTIEIESVDGTVKRDIQYTMDGRAVEIEESIDVKALPGAVQQSITKQYPKGKITRAERTTQEDKLQFEVVVAVGQDRTEVVMDSTGKVLKTEAKKKTESKDKD